jgi:PD-(D/E)XK endonuclease
MVSEAVHSALNLKAKGDLAELRVAVDLRRRGLGVALPFGEDNDFDLILIRPDRLERVQVKYTQSNGRVITVRCHSHPLTNGKVRKTKRYTAETIDTLAVYDAATDRCFYVPAAELGNGKSMIHLRLTPALNKQVSGTRPAERYLDPLDPPVEPAGIEPATS